MSTFKTRDIRKSLLDKGFEKNSSHHEMYWLHIEGRKTSVRTRLSHGSTEYGDNLLGQMAAQLRLRRRQLDELVECPMSGKDYIDHLVRHGHVRFAD